MRAGFNLWYFVPMKATSTSVALALVGVLAVFALWPCRGLAKPGSVVTNNSNPFADIAERNVFGLRPAPDIKLQQGPPKAPIDIKISGFVKHAKEPTRVLLASVPKDPKQRMKLYNLGVGETRDGVQLVKIHPGQDAVDVVIDGVPQELTVKSNSFLTALYKKTTPQPRLQPRPAPRMYGNNAVYRPPQVPIPIRRGR
jgi:hypothetical protein